ncbi:hypothetical protein [Adhaeribacter pallidiroseus]|uniref:Uncharacterized protein n=1 Tax=Adhaeribacter pallidiroseus TaxID=2072847 RepID=A0A369QCF1_9BACT|nr:hypothetical protein [Adhaeribacter pallidiroseus]RDC62571.1 hypothetical protein AHMF7616_01165 [Adhaeribacter pallidiroseus]
MLPNTISNPIATLQHLLEFLTGSQLIDLVTNPDGSTIRLDWQLPAKTKMFWLTRILRLVLMGQPNLFYLSYPQTTSDRPPITAREKILSKNLILQGAQMSGSQALILYGHSAQPVEAGELHLNLKNYQLYDDQYGRIDVADFLLRLRSPVKAD